MRLFQKRILNHKRKREKIFIHKSALVDDGASIDPGTSIWHFTHIREDVRVGRDCNIGQNVYIAPGVIIGNGVKVQNNVSIYEGVKIEDYVFIGPSAVFTNVINPRSEISRKDEYKETLVKRGATVGANATIICGTTLGKYSFIAAGAVVTKDISDFSLVMGVPAVPVGWMCACGVRLKFDESDYFATCRTCSSRYSKGPEGVTLQTKGEEEIKR